MWWLFLEIWVWIVIAFVLGWAAHWFICCRGNDSTQVTSDTVASKPNSANLTTTPPTAVRAPAISDNWKPQGFASQPDSVDDLKRIKGIGAVIEKTLNELGVYQFQQISKWDLDNVKWVENFLAFPGRIDREDWINQADTLSTGGTTEFAKRVDKGDVDYKS